MSDTWYFFRATCDLLLSNSRAALALFLSNEIVKNNEWIDLQILVTFKKGPYVYMGHEHM